MENKKQEMHRIAKNIPNDLDMLQTNETKPKNVIKVPKPCASTLYQAVSNSKCNSRVNEHLAVHPVFA
jgi:hypothetical protein